MKNGKRLGIARCATRWAGVLLYSAGLTAGVAAAADTLTPTVTWQDNLAVIQWHEPLADPDAGTDEIPFSILSGPYLGWLTPSEAIVGWEVIAQRQLSTSPYASLPAKYPMENIQFRWVRLSDLKANTPYRYQLQSGRYRSEVHSFRTLPDKTAASFKFAIIGDTQRGQVPESAEVERRLFGLIQDWQPALMLHLGDMLGTGRGDGPNGRKGWYRALQRNRSLRAGVFMAPTLGNHCWLGQGHGWYADYFSQIGGGRPAKDGSCPPFFYSFDVATVHFVCLCTESAKIAGGQDVSQTNYRDLPFSYDQQLAWFQSDLQRSEALWKIVFFHQPFHTAGGYPAPPYFPADFGAVCDKYGVQLLLSGHDHSYQRTRRIRNVDRQLSDTGTVQIVSGGGDIRQFDARPNRPSWNVVHKKVNHYVQIEVHPDALHITPIDLNGQPFDPWRLPLRGQPEASEPNPTRSN